MPLADVPTAPPSPIPVYSQGVLRRHDTLFYQKDSICENVATTHQLPEANVPTAPPSPLPVVRQGIFRRHGTLFSQQGLKDDEEVVNSPNQEQYVTTDNVSSLRKTLKQYNVGKVGYGLQGSLAYRDIF
ncbi:hypothetical protein F5880DRAFT_1614436 [Lentinula raphanica]|nr:hypothetical protein EV360DRAFT_89736 [Lentinula raphanica]KAJ3821718.1 hypothetical protein F5880DRAFT_1614436 [Lentinula raphanica]